MENMGIYFKDNQKKSRWDSGQAILHRENQETEKQQKDGKSYEVKNAYGRLNYVKKDKENGPYKEGFTLEAFESPGTPVHTEKEKHLDRSTMKKVSHGNERTLYTSETPLRNQAIFYEMPGSKRSSAFLNCMKKLVHQQGHQTLHDAFGFLEQEPERLELDEHKKAEENFSPNEKERELSPEEFELKNKRINTLNSRLLRKEAMERQLCSELQTMLDQRPKEELTASLSEQRQEEGKKQQNPKGKKNHGSRKNIQSLSGSEATDAALGNSTAEDAVEEGTEEPEEEII